MYAIAAAHGNHALSYVHFSTTIILNSFIDFGHFIVSYGVQLIFC